MFMDLGPNLNPRSLHTACGEPKRVRSFIGEAVFVFVLERSTDG